MAKKLLGILVDVENEKSEVMEVEDTLDELYRILNCSAIDIVRRQVGSRRKKTFEIVCDDEGLFKDPQKISAIDNLGAPQLVGNIFIVGKATVDGELTSLEESDIAYLKNKILHTGTRNFPAGYPMLTQCEY